MPTNQPLRIIIAGAGLGGLAAACRFAKDGHQVELFERSKSLSTASGAIFIRSNAVRCFCRWQMRNAFEAVTAEIRNHQTRNGIDNELLQRLSSTGFSEYPEWSTDREALQNLLYEQARAAGARITFGAEIADISEAGNLVYATCQDGAKYTGDLLLAADGISSRLRATILSGQKPTSLTPIPAPSVHYPTEIPRDRLLANTLTKSLIAEPDADDSIMWAGHGGYAIGKYNHARQLFNLMFSIQDSSEDYAKNPRLFDEIGDTSIVKDFFKRYHPILGALSGMTESCSRWRLARLEPLDTWSSQGGRLVLLGDSAHAMLPNLAQGFSCIVEDIEVLSLLLENGGDVSSIVKSWEDIRIPRVTRLQDGSLWNYRLYTSGKAPGEELSEEDKKLPMGEGNGNAPFNSLPFLKWVFDYDAAKEATTAIAQAHGQT
ncbi:salicylate hydroxylase [Pochonia chlamydosporia 170]|uniref:Salicylate hydroxylase n=1 Tax=Pochonia chlamydosporia 170 TaxID=1380566 RepID=A0A179FGR3_METCM|nr:salicylate hydroxylase [Pochonia chlamydosporia 170]OAQ64597.1 salicylate hydroxylase [Pochonia chlamydosporia 170]